VRGHGAEAQPVRVDPLDVDGRQRSLEFAGNLQRNRDAAAGHTDDHRLIQLERSDGLRHDAAGGSAIAKERRDPRDETHSLIVPGRSSGESGDRPTIRCRSSAKERQQRASTRSGRTPCASPSRATQAVRHLFERRRRPSCAE